MRLRIGYELDFDFPQPTPVLSVLNVHFSRASDLEAPDLIRLDPPVPLTSYRDGFGNWCGRFTAPAGAHPHLHRHGDPRQRPARPGRPRRPPAPDRGAARRGAGLPARQPLLRERPHARPRLAASSAPPSPAGRGCRRSATSSTTTSASTTSRPAPPARPSRATHEGVGVCRDYAHLAVAFCRALNIPARYCTGYLGDVGTPPPYPPGDFAAWFEAYLGGAWRLFDPRNNVPRQSRVLMAHGRDAADVALTTTFGPGVMHGLPRLDRRDPGRLTLADLDASVPLLRWRGRRPA